MGDSGEKSFSHPPQGAPELAGVTAAFKELCITIAWLRDPEKGCPWDLKQTNASLRRFMIEEAYEAAEAMTKQPDAHLCEELGDVLLQVVLNAQVAKDAGAFSIEDVIRALDAKMRRRHPHVFAPEITGKSVTSETALRESWESIKAKEKQGARETPAADVFKDVKAKHPATLQALAIGKIAARIQFDWDHPQAVLDQVRAEVEETAEELRRSPLNIPLAAEEIGDIYFSLAQLCRQLGLDPEVVSLDANQKFLRRFATVEELAQETGLDLETAGRDRLESLWQIAKSKEKKG